MLEAKGDTRRVQAEVIQDNTDWGDFVTEFVFATDSGIAPDIWLTGHEYIGVQAAAERIISLDDMIDDYPEFDNVFDNLWESVKWKDKIWGIPQDAEARPIYWNKPLLRKPDWSDSEIEALPEKIKKG